MATSNIFTGIWLIFLFINAASSTVPTGGKERFWRRNLMMVNEVKLDRYLWKTNDVSKLKCSSECTMDTKCVSYFYNSLSMLCIAHSSRLDDHAMLVKVTGFDYYSYRPEHCIDAYTYDYKNDVCYRVFTTALEYAGAKLTCSIDGGQLITVKDGLKQTFLEELLDSLNLSSGAKVFIGGTDIVQENHFVWDDGEPFSYTNWAVGEPNNEMNREDCIMVLSTHGGWNWFDFPCTGYPILYICELTRN